MVPEIVLAVTKAALLISGLYVWLMTGKKRMAGVCLHIIVSLCIRLPYLASSVEELPRAIRCQDYSDSSFFYALYDHPEIITLEGEDDTNYEQVHQAGAFFSWSVRDRWVCLATGERMWYIPESFEYYLNVAQKDRKIVVYSYKSAILFEDEDRVF